MRILTPVVVSASRATDVPKFYADWLLTRLRAGFCTWTNPFNRQEYSVSFEKTRAIVFWTKDPKPLLSRLDELEDLGFHQYYFQFTLNDYVREGLEPNVPSVEERIATCSASGWSRSRGKTRHKTGLTYFMVWKGRVGVE